MTHISTHSHVCRLQEKKSYSDPRKQKQTCGFYDPSDARGNQRTADALDHGGALVGQSWGLLIYTFRKIIHVQGIPLPIWLGRTREGGVFEAEASQKPEQETNNGVASFPQKQTAINGRTLDSATKTELWKRKQLSNRCSDWLTSRTWEKAAAQTEKSLLLENIWKYLITFEGHHVTYLKWSKEEVKLPRFNVDRQTADKQCSYLQTESMENYLITWWMFGVRLLSEKPSFRRSPPLSSLLLSYRWIQWTFTNRKPFFISDEITVRRAALSQTPEMSHWCVVLMSSSQLKLPPVQTDSDSFRLLLLIHCEFISWFALKPHAFKALI